MSTVPQQLVDYLSTMITPTHVGGESLTALDLDAVDWAAIPDERYHGIIARGTPTEEQTKHMMRIIKPGAHVMLMSPDDCPTGYKGACMLEDNGFEIRDAILVVDEPGHLHYVPKAASKERHAGTEHLAAKRAASQAVVYDLLDCADVDEVAELEAAMTEAGVSDEIIAGMPETGVSKDLIPKGYSHLFKKRENAGRYGNIHPCVKPKDVMKRLLSDVPLTATVLDPFMGSGSTGIACLETGHNFIGIDLEAPYIEIADARIRHLDHENAGWNGAEIVSDAPALKREMPVPDTGLFGLFGGDDE